MLDSVPVSVSRYYGGVVLLCVLVVRFQPEARNPCFPNATLSS